jgi:hypothetical protein
MWQYLFELKKIKIKEFVTEYFIFRKNVLHFAEEKKERKRPPCRNGSWRMQTTKQAGKKTKTLRRRKGFEKKRDLIFVRCFFCIPGTVEEFAEL